MDQDFLGYWGKAQPRTDGPSWHPLIYHSLDVAAVGRALLGARPGLLTRIAELGELPAEVCADWVALLLAWHDMGKFADGFQALVPEIRAELGRHPATVTYQRRHDVIGHEALEDLLLEDLLDDVLERFHPGADSDEEDLIEALTPWIAAVTGHHGVPPGAVHHRGDRQSDPVSRQFPAHARAAAAAWCAMSFDLLWGRPLPFDVESPDAFASAAKRVSWLVAGLAVAADWLGSDQGWFPYHAPTLAPAEYWRDVARPRAMRAVRESGMGASEAVPSLASSELLPVGATPTPLQAYAAEVELPAGPQVWLLEEATGGGKTEAALMLAHRLMAGGHADGIFVALPTMATANAMYGRIEAVAPRLFGPTAAMPVLSHGRARLAHALAARARAEGDYAPGDLSASTRSASWFGDHRKAGLLAPLGAGTIDQALLGVLSSRHQSLRLLGLARAVLIVDEVHACDAYMHRLLCRLLTFQAAFGGSAILLSATLAEHTREALFTAFADGLGAERPMLSDMRFPRVSGFSSEGAVEAAPSSRASCQRRVAVELTDAVDDVVERLVEAAEGGRCAAWVRNTVDDAIEAAEVLAARIGAERVELFHARFTLGDRLAIESRVLGRFGPHSGPGDRRGRVVVATQVIEQSLDLDFDLMVSDIAPIDLLVQRAGRLCRHRRNGDGRRLDEPDAPDARGTPTLWVLGPHPDLGVDARWLRRVLPRMAPVYPDVGALWRTARWLVDQGGFSLPGDARDMIEGVFGIDAKDTYPEALAEAVVDAEGEVIAAGVTAQMSALLLDLGYAAGQPAWLDESKAMTRLGEPTVTLRLARVSGGDCGPWSDDPAFGWSLSELSVRAARVSAEAPSAARWTARARATMRDKGEHIVVVPLTVDAGGVGRGEALDGHGRRVGLTYHPHTGLAFERGRGEA